MIVYLVHIKKYIVKKNVATKKTYPVDNPRHSSGQSSEILVEVTDKFPAAFHYWDLNPSDFENKSKVMGFKNIKNMFVFFDEKNINVGTTLGSFYKIKKEVPLETPLNGTLIYSYKNISIYALRLA